MLVRTMYNDETGLTLYPVSQYRCVLPDHPQDQAFAGQAMRSTCCLLAALFLYPAI